jgi:hypothetical protein
MSVVSTMTTVRAVALTMRIVRAAVSITIVRVATAASTTVRAVALTMKRNPVVAARDMSGRKTRSMTARKPLAKSA